MELSFEIQDEMDLILLSVAGKGQNECYAKNFSALVF